MVASLQVLPLQTLSGSSTSTRLEISPAPKMVQLKGVSALADFFVDTKRPALDALSKADGDTILPVSNDTITDGTLNSGRQQVPQRYSNAVLLEACGAA